ncbi:hypothetical protein GGI07_002720 [Coemansia sp. Benny D115]|nr:hypothetical protein GGI07_002720 [Coemansia sp. Benny D115]
MDALAKEDQDLLTRVMAAAGAATPEQCLLMPFQQVQRSAGLNTEQTHKARKLLGSTLYPWQNKIRLASSLESLESYISIGDTLIDQCLGGGLRRGAVTEVVGESGSGKTQLCLQLVLSALLDAPQGGSVVYISTEGAFPVERLVSMAHARCRQENVDTQMLLERVLVAELDNMETLVHALEYKVPGFLDQGVRLVVVDSIAAHLRFGSEDEGTHEFYRRRSSVLIGLGSKLRLWAHRYSCAFVCVNQVTDVIGDGLEAQRENRKAPALGAMWANVVDARVFMHYQRGLGVVLDDSGGANADAKPDGPRRWIENAIAPWAAPARCEVVLDERGFHSVC